MGWEFCNTKHIKKTRKPHRCVFCGRLIPAETSNIYNWNGVFNGDFQNSYACNWCEDHQNRLVDDYDNEIMDFGDCLIEDIFQSELEPLNKRVYFINEGDFFVFKSYKEDKEILRVKCPISRECV
jgi:hypothetical protein